MTLIFHDAKLITFHGLGICRKCKTYHEDERITADLLGKAAFDWQFRHRQCELDLPGSVEYAWKNPNVPGGLNDRLFEKLGHAPPYLMEGLRPNANGTIVYVADAAFTMDLSALGSSATFVAGREATSVSNSSNYLDSRVSGTYISGTTPTTPAESRLYLVTPTEDTPAWPDVFDGTDSAETVANTNILDTLPLIWSGTVSASSNITYPIVSALTLAQAIGFVPKAFTVFFSHAHTAALKTDAGNTNSLFYQFAQFAIA